MSARSRTPANAVAAPYNRKVRNASSALAEQGSVSRFFRFTPATLHAPWRLFWVAFAVRVLYMTVAGTWHIRLLLDHFQFGWELGRIARSVALGHGYANPFLGPTGPTAWIPPLYTLMVAAVFKLCGIYSPLSAWVIFALNSVFSAATALAVYEIAARCFGQRVALWSGWLWALYPAAMQYAVHWVWDMSLTTWLFAAVLVTALRARRIDCTHLAPPSPVFREAQRNPDGQRIRRWINFGLLWGLIALSNPSLLIALPVIALWMLWGTWHTAHELEHAIRGAACAALVFALCLAPWTYRNWLVFHAFLPTRGNLGAELFESTRESNQGFPWGTTLPLADRAPELIRYRTLGELEYNRQQSAAAKIFIHEHPRLIAGWVAKRVYFFWASTPHPLERHPSVEYLREANFGLLSVTGLLGLALALRRHIPAAAMFLATFLVIPLPYYAITVQARFRHPLEPLICILSVFLFQSADRSRAFSWQTLRPAAQTLKATPYRRRPVRNA